MDKENQKDEFQPPSKRFRLSSDSQEPEQTSKFSKESISDGDSVSRSSSPENRQGSMVDHESDDSIDNMSELSNLSGLDDHADETSWQPLTGAILWVQRQMALGRDPREVLKDVVDGEPVIPPGMDPRTIWNGIITLLMEPLPRKKLPDINTIDDVVSLLRSSSKIMVLTGAGVSVSCGIPDFRSRDGIYARLSVDFPDLPDPQAMFDISYFKRDQRPFFKFAKEIYPGQFEPSRSHKFIRLLESKGKLLRNYTQNIDTLEKVAGIERAIECHGSFATATCMECDYSVDAEAIRQDIFEQEIPRCPHCSPDVEFAVMKPDIVFFGESLPQKFHRHMAIDKSDVDLLIVIGSSLKVRPVALIPSSIPESVPQILINREPLKRMNFDVELLGNCDDIISELCKRLGDGWDHLATPGPPAEEVSESDLPPLCDPPRHDPMAMQGQGREEVVEHSTDSGLGDFDHNATGPGDGGTSSSTPQAATVSCLTAKTTTPEDKLKRLNSSDSGEDSISTPEIQRSQLEFPARSLTSPSASATSKTHSAPSDDGGGGGGGGDGGEEVVSHCDQCTEISLPEKCNCNREQGDTDTKCTCNISQNHTDSDSSQHRVNASETHTNRDAHSSSSEGHHHHHKHRSAHSHTNREKEKVDIEKESQKDNAHCSHTDTIDDIRRMWEPRTRLSLANRITGNQYIHKPPSRYIFPGAEVFSDSDTYDSEDDDDDSIPFISTSSDSSSPSSGQSSPENRSGSPENHSGSPENHGGSPDNHRKSPERHIKSPEILAVNDDTHKVSEGETGGETGPETS